MLALILVACIAAVTTLGDKVQATFEAVNAALSRSRGLIQAPRPRRDRRTQ